MGTLRPDALRGVSFPLTQPHEALAQADAVVVAIARTPETTHLLGDAGFETCKPGA